MDNTPSFFSRLAIAFKLIFSGQYAQSILQPSAAETLEDAPAEVTEKAPQPVNYDSALQLIAILQKDGRLIDFIQEDVNQFSDEQVAAAARVVHQGVKKALNDHVQFSPATKEPEGSAITLNKDFDRNQYRLTGNINGEGPFHGTLIHKGWCVDKVVLPEIVSDTDLTFIAPAEVEV
ncbi:MAG: DUF2760 domain-containing protein [Aestuariibacter sp.]